MNPLARAVYNMVAEGGDDVLRAAGRAAKKIDPRTAKEAIKRVADDVVEAADDWGWKGGKPGELTGEKLKYYFEAHPRTLDRRVTSLVPKSQQRIVRKAEKQLERFRKKYPNSAVARRMSLRTEWGAEDIGTLFAAMERADIPRAWTGKVAAALPDKLLYTFNRGNYVSKWDEPAKLKEISDAMRPMTNDQREEFLALLPEWTESLDDLANAVRML